MTLLIVFFFAPKMTSRSDGNTSSKCSGGNKTEAIEKLLAAGAEAGAEHGTRGELKH